MRPLYYGYLALVLVTYNSAFSMQTLLLEDTTQTEAIAVACKVLAAGGLLLFPTETTYGAGVDATNPKAVQKLLGYKSRREGKPLSIAVPTLEEAEKYVELNQQAKTLATQFLPGPVTIVCKSKGSVAPGVASEFGTLGIRIPDYPFILELLKAYGKPITATSANASNQKRPYTISDVLNNLSGAQKKCIDLILDAGTLPPNPPSTVIDTTLSTPITLRQGEKRITDGKTQHVTTTTAQETQDLAGKLLLQHWNASKKSGLIIGLNGPLGAGKTVFTKGLATFLGISETITSPTYSYIEEYDYTRYDISGKFYHLDIWKIESEAELERLELPSLPAPQNIVTIEWFSLADKYIFSLCNKYEIPILIIDIEQKNNTRNITILSPHESNA